MDLYKSLGSIVARLVSIVSKFLLSSFLAKTLALSEYGEFQLVSYFVVLSVYIYGIEYYMIGNREFAVNTDDIGQVNKHINFFVTLLPFTFIIQIVALFLLVPKNVLTPYYIVLILLINFCEYFNQEVYRYLIIVEKFTQANLLLVIKNGLFFLLVLGYYFANHNIIGFDATILILFLSYIILFLITLLFFFSFILKKKRFTVKPLNVAELKQVFTSLSPFIVLMIFTKGIEFFDKFAIKHFINTEQVGVYSYLFSIASLIYIFIVTGFYLVYLPQLIKLYQSEDIALKHQLKKFSLLVVITSILLMVAIVLFIDFLLALIGNKGLIENINILYILLLAFFFLNVSLIPSIVLYIAKKESVLMINAGIIFLINMVLNVTLIQYFSTIGAAFALFISYSIGFLYLSYRSMAVWKTISVKLT